MPMLSDSRFRVFLTSALFVVAFSFASTVRAAVLDEWKLPLGLVELDVDASTGHPISLVEPFGEIDQFDPTAGKLLQWKPGPAALQFATPGQIESARDAAGAPVIFVTDGPHDRIGRMNIATGTYTFWNLPLPIARTPHALSFDTKAQQVWFTTYDGALPPSLSRLDTATGNIAFWPLPAAIAGPPDKLDGVAVFRGAKLLVYFGVPTRNLMVEVDPVAGVARVWNLRFANPTRIAVNKLGEVFAPNANTNIVLRLQPAVNKETIWADGNTQFMPFISVNTIGHPTLPGKNGGPVVVDLNPVGAPIAIAPAFFAVSLPGVFSPPTTVAAPLNVIPLPLAVFAVPPVVVAPFTRWPVPGNGPLSCDPTSAGNDVWFIDQATHSIARLP